MRKDSAKVTVKNEVSPAMHIEGAKRMSNSQSEPGREDGIEVW